MIYKEEAFLQDWDLTQIINGKEVMFPSPKIRHQKISKKLHKIIENFVERGDHGEIYYAPLDVIFEENINRVQPDLIFISKENLEIAGDDWIRGVPELLVEIVSKSSYHLDTIEKKELYERFGVKEYWIVFPEYETIEIYFLKNGQFELFSNASGSQVIESRLLAGLHFQADFIFS
ncbi:Uma2 family endonuclease [Dyadobacter sp. CY356]|uniref:Uma2 family endonuclease n=1 Tax=Dyadobacter sp. CY356 TaxID=2906442 RepID=UPI001F3C739D|nr:Uma2 family endonuclease [Dyadobacter sp. CY356]MCF0054451.1 Uma2 family endonuclease [Dyadobacter sp. CY356]